MTTRTSIDPLLPEGLTIIPADSSHHGFIAATWFKSSRHDWSKVPEDVYYSFQKKHVAALLETASALVIVDAEDTYRVIGWVCYTHHVLHYAYVRAGFRGNGLFRALTSGLDLQICDHCTREFQPHRRGLVYVPFFYKGEL